MSADATPDQMPFAAMEARSVEELPRDSGWQFEPKWDGFRCIAVKQGDAVELLAKSGRPLGRYFTDVMALLEQCADQYRGPTPPVAHKAKPRRLSRAGFW